MDKAYTRITWQNSPSVATPLGATNLNRLDIATDAIDNRVVAMDTSKANVATINAMVRDMTFNNADGKLTVTYQNGTTSVIDTAMEKIVTNFSYNSTTQSIDLTLADGSTQSIDISSFVTNVDFENTSTVAWSVVEGKTRATVPDGSITDAKIESGYLAGVTTQAGIATAQAALSKRYAVGGVVEGDATDNAKYYYEQAQAIVGIDIATTEVAGLVKPDGTTINVDADGVISVVGGGTVTVETVGSGVLYNSGLSVTAQSTPNMTVAISACTAYMPTGERAVISAVASQAITTADATNPRKDIMYVNSSKVTSYLVGTASATPTAPSLPSGGVLLAEIYVGANVTLITNANITDKRSIIKSNADLVSEVNKTKKLIGINVLDYGANGNDLFINDTAFNNAINEAILRANNTDSSVEVIIPTGIYRISTYLSSLRQTTILTLKDLKNIKLVGQGKNTVIKGYSETGFDVFQLNGVENLSIENLSITAVKTNPSDTTYGINGVSITNGTRNIILDRLYVFDLPYVVKADYVDGGKAYTVQQGSLGVSNCENIYIKNCSTNENVAFGFECDYDGQETYMPQNINVYDNEFNAFYEGISISGSAPSAGNYIPKLTGSIYNNSLIGSQIGILLSRSSGFKANDNQIINMDIAVPSKVSFDTSVTPIVLEGTEYAEVLNNYIYYARCDSYLKIGALYTGASNECNVSNNIFTGHCIGIAHSTIEIGGSTCTNSKFIGNIFKNYGGLLVDSKLFTSDNLFIYGNISKFKKIGINTSGESDADLAINGSIGFAYTNGKSIYTKLGVDTFAVTVQQTGSSDPLEKVFIVKNNTGVNKFVITSNGAIRSDNYETIVVPTSQNRRIPWYGTDGTVVGYIPLYN